MENKNYINTKPVLTIQEASEYTGFSVGYLHQLTAAKKIPFNKPNGKAIFFDRKELEDWMMGRRSLENQFIEIPQRWVYILHHSKKEDIVAIIDNILAHSMDVLLNPLSTSAQATLIQLMGAYTKMLSEERDNVIRVNIYDFLLNNNLKKAEQRRKMYEEQAELAEKGLF